MVEKWRFSSLAFVLLPLIITLTKTGMYHIESMKTKSRAENVISNTDNKEITITNIGRLDLI